MIYLYVIGWLFCSIASYFIFRFVEGGPNGEDWTVGSRIVFLMMSIVCGPASLFAAFLALLLFGITMKWGDKKARW